MNLDQEKLTTELRDLYEELIFIEESTNIRAIKPFEMIRVIHQYKIMLNDVAKHINNIKNGE